MSVNELLCMIAEYAAMNQLWQSLSHCVKIRQ